MKEFNLERALAGEPVVTRDGREVFQLHLFKDTYYAPLYGVIGGHVYAFTQDGRYGGKHDTVHDLFMKPVILEAWLNVYKQDDSIWVGQNHESQYEAKLYGSNEPNYVKTIRITDEL